MENGTMNRRDFITGSLAAGIFMLGGGSDSDAADRSMENGPLSKLAGSIFKASKEAQGKASEVVESAKGTIGTIAVTGNWTVTDAAGRERNLDTATFTIKKTSDDKLDIKVSFDQTDGKPFASRAHFPNVTWESK